MFEAMLQGEMNNHLGYNNNSKEKKETDNRRNGYIDKTVKTSLGEMNIAVPRNRDGSFEPVIMVLRNQVDLRKKLVQNFELIFLYK
jgi:transposase-like protein